MTPKWVHALLRGASGRQTIEDVLGDLEEAHRRRLNRHGRFVATVMRGVEVLELSFLLLRERLRQRAGRGGRVNGGGWVSMQWAGNGPWANDCTGVCALASRAWM